MKYKIDTNVVSILHLVDGGFQIHGVVAVDVEDGIDVRFVLERHSTANNTLEHFSGGCHFLLIGEVVRHDADHSLVHTPIGFITPKLKQSSK